MHFLKYYYLQIITLCLSFFLLISCSSDSHNHPELKTGKQFFDYHCASCHDTSGMGSFLKGMPANILNDKTQAELIHYIKHGNTAERDKMPVFKTMPDKEAKQIARHLLKLKSNYLQHNNQLDKKSSLSKFKGATSAGKNKQLDKFSNSFKSR
ncbi:MAG: cytochrome c [gamma proteobacterium symbiont of Taylorina sp.]|nr:cytochrome c [gamma proteobacterium symbiont of Taylorina sp.]